MSLTTPVVPTALRFRRAAVITAAGLSGPLILVSMLVDPARDLEGAAMVQAYADDLTASGLHTTLIYLGFALVAPLAYATIGLVRSRGAWLANVAGMLAIVGLGILPGLFLQDFAFVATLRAAGPEALAAMNAELEGLVWLTSLAAVGLPSALLTLPFATTALWRAGLVPWLLPATCLVSTIALQFGPVWWLNFGLFAAWTAALAVFLARIPIERWFPTPAPQRAGGLARATTEVVP